MWCGVLNSIYSQIDNVSYPHACMLGTVLFRTRSCTGIKASSLMQNVIRSVRPLSRFRLQLRAAVRPHQYQPLLLKPSFVRPRCQSSRPVSQFGYSALFSSFQRPIPSRDSSIVRAESLQHMHTNRLASEESPYLLQHQHNPVGMHAMAVHGSACCCLAEL